MLDSQFRSLALVGAVALSGCSSDSSRANDPNLTSLEKATVRKTNDGGALLILNELSDRDRLQAIAQWRQKNPGDYIIRYGDPLHPLSSTWVQFVPAKGRTSGR